MTVIGTNVAALQAGNASSSASSMLATSIQRLSTGKRINSAKDDAAGLAIASSLTAQISGQSQAIRNANDGIALAQTADGTLGEASNILQRIRELAVQSASGTYQDSDRADMQTEVTELQKQLTSIAATKYNGNSLFSSASTGTSVSIQTGSGSTDTVTLKISQLDLTPISGTTSSVAAGLNAALGSGDPQVGTTHVITAQDVAYGAQFKDVTLANHATNAGSQNVAASADIGKTITLATGDLTFKPGTTANNTSSAVTVGTQQGASDALSVIDAALTQVNQTRASIGAGESRLTSVVNTLTSSVSNLTAAKSSIEDVDFSSETTKLAKAQILSQASVAMLAQANQSQQGVLKLLQ